MSEFDPDEEKREFLREIADEVRGDSGESKQVAAMLYRVSDLYDESEDTSPEDIYLNLKHLLKIREHGTLERG